MKSFVLLIVLLFGIKCFKSISQKRYGYTILHFRCGEKDEQRDRIYYSPIIELNTLNFPEYTTGMDTAIVPYSTRYYKYAIAKWFERYLRKKYNILINASGRYARKSVTVVHNTNSKAACNEAKTNLECFFTDRQELATLRTKSIIESRLPELNGNTCEVVDLE